MINRRSEPAFKLDFHRAFKLLKISLESLKSRMNPTLFTLVCSRKPLAEVPRALPVRASGLVGSSGLEPPTSRLSGARSNQLSYEPICWIESVLLRHPRVLSSDSR